MERGKGMAIAGLVLSILGTVIAIGLGLLGLLVMGLEQGSRTWRL